MNPYEVLEIPPGSSPEEVKAAYHRLAKQWHPDRFTGQAKVDAEARFRMLAEAFNMVKDSGRRGDYAGRQAQAPAPPAPQPAPAAPAAQAAQPQIQLDNAPEERAAQPKDAEGWYKEAKAAFDAKGYSRALALITYALRMDGEQAEFHAFHGKVLDVLGGDDRTKVRALEKAIKLNPKDVDSTILLARTFQNLGMQARATRLWEVVHNLAPNHPIFKSAGKAAGKAKPKEQLQGLGEQFSALVAEWKVALARIFKRG